jgi:beta-galactosidase
MGNSNGTLADHWAAIESTPALHGCFIRESWSHGILQRVNDGRPVGRGAAGPHEGGVAAPGQRRACGGDLGKPLHDGVFITDGMVFPDRAPQPVRYERREIAAPVRQPKYLRHEGIAADDHQHFRGPHLDTARQGLGTASCGPASSPPCLVAPGGHRRSRTSRAF